jgi:hypothetical protein
MEHARETDVQSAISSDLPGLIKARAGWAAMRRDLRIALTAERLNGLQIPRQRLRTPQVRRPDQGRTE